MDVLSSRLLLHPTDPERSRVFYRDTLGLAIYREFGSGPDRGMVFFLGGGFLELSGRAAAPPAPGMALWLQVRELAGVRRELGGRGVPILRGAQAGAVGAAGDVDCGPRWGADLHRGGAGGASAAPPRLTRTSVSSMACRGGGPIAGQSSPTCRRR
jgi:catechol 2,3-dioxygenase-like lactoylglutathione lyase family enzyme